MSTSAGFLYDCGCLLLNFVRSQLVELRAELRELRLDRDGLQEELRKAEADLRQADGSTISRHVFFFF